MTDGTNEMDTTPASEPTTPSIVPVLVVFVHPDGRELPAVVTAEHGDNIVDLVVFEGISAIPHGTGFYDSVPYSDAVAGQESARYTWRH